MCGFIPVPRENGHRPSSMPLSAAPRGRILCDPQLAHHSSAEGTFVDCLVCADFLFNLEEE